MSKITLMDTCAEKSYAAAAAVAICTTLTRGAVTLRQNTVFQGFCSFDYCENLKEFSSIGH